MQDTGITTPSVPQTHNFAISLGQARQNQRTWRIELPFSLAEPSPAKPRSCEDLAQLNTECMTAWLCWYTLFCDPDVWEDAAKRRAMLRARMAYQDLELELTLATRNQ